MSVKERIGSLLEPGQSLSQRVARGGVWVFGIRIAERGFGIVRLIILARLLAPHDFGLMGIALLAMMTLETFSQTGFQQALIQRKESTEEYLDAAWTFSALRSFILFVILFFAAPYVSLFFDAPLAIPIIRVIGASFLLRGFINIGVIYFQKELEFNKQFIYQLSGTLADFAIAVSAAIILKSVWALVFGLLAGNVVRFFVSYLIHPYRPHLSFDLGKAKELFDFGRWILGSSILVFLITQGDDIFVGKMLAATALGFYQMAYRISNAPTTEITLTVSQVSFPAFSKLQENLPKLKEAYLQVVRTIALVSFPLAGGIFAIAYPFTYVVLGDKWLPMVPAMQLLTLQGAMRALGATTGPLFQSVGKPKLRTKLGAIHFAMMAGLLYPLISYWGIFGAALTIVTTGIILNFFVYPEVFRIIHCSLIEFIKAIILPIINTVLMIGILFALTNFAAVNHLLEIVGIILLAGAIYFISFFYIDKLQGSETFILLKKQLRALL